VRLFSCIAWYNIARQVESHPIFSSHNSFQYSVLGYSINNNTPILTMDPSHRLPNLSPSGTSYFTCSSCDSSYTECWHKVTQTPVSFRTLWVKESKASFRFTIQTSGTIFFAQNTQVGPGANQSPYPTNSVGKVDRSMHNIHLYLQMIFRIRED
jgi:hypothetical protein